MPPKRGMPVVRSPMPVGGQIGESLGLRRRSLIRPFMAKKATASRPGSADSGPSLQP